MKIVLSAEDRFRNLQRENSILRMQNLDLMEMIADFPIVSPGVPGTAGYSLVYALRQHEELLWRHDRTDGYRRKDGSTVNMIAGGEAKYLERPFDENKKKYAKHIQEAVKQTLE